MKNTSHLSRQLKGPKSTAFLRLWLAELRLQVFSADLQVSAIESDVGIYCLIIWFGRESLSHRIELHGFVGMKVAI
jgi:hypothetical protein